MVPLTRSQDRGSSRAGRALCVLFRPAKFPGLLSYLLTVLVACTSESQEGSDDPVVVTMDDQLGCQGHEYALHDLDASTPLGFAPRDVLASLPSSYTLTLTWLPPDTEPVWFRGAGSNVQLEIEFEHRSGELRYLESIDCAEPGSCTLVCASRIELPVHVTYRSEDGLFNETWPIFLGARDVGSAFFLIRPFDPDATLGTLSSADFITLEGYEVLYFSLFADFRDGTCTGFLDADVVTEGAGAFVPVATWGPA